MDSDCDLVDCEMVRKCSSIYFSNFNEYSLIYAIIAIKHDLFSTLTFAMSFKALPWVINISFGTWRMLMHEKTCLNPILSNLRIYQPCQDVL